MSESRQRHPDGKVVVTSEGRLAGCRGRVLIAVLLTAALAVFLCVALVWGLTEESRPIPAPANGPRAPPEP